MCVCFETRLKLKLLNNSERWKADEKVRPGFFIPGWVSELFDMLVRNTETRDGFVSLGWAHFLCFSLKIS